MDPEENKAVIKRLVEEYNSNNLDLLAKVFQEAFHPSGSFRFIQSTKVNVSFDIDEMLADHSQWMGSKIKINNKILYLVAEGDKVVVLTEKILSYIEEFENVPKGTTVVYKIFNCYHFKDGKIYWIDRISDLLKGAKDLGKSRETTEIDVSIDRAQVYLDNLRTLGML